MRSRLVKCSRSAHYKEIREEAGADIANVDTDGTWEGKIHPSDPARSVRVAETAREVTCLNVCAVGSKRDLKQFSFADAWGVKQTTKGRAIIEYKRSIVGKEADELAFETLQEWKKGGTLKEALERAKATMRSRGRSVFFKGAAKMQHAGYAPHEVVLSGDGNIKFSALTGSPAQVGR